MCSAKGQKLVSVLQREVCGGLSSLFEAANLGVGDVPNVLCRVASPKLTSWYQRACLDHAASGHDAILLHHGSLLHNHAGLDLGAVTC